MARIVTVYNKERLAAIVPQDMAHIRWRMISEALARLGHQVDMATAEHKFRLRKPIVAMGDNLRRVPLERVRWEDYDVVKTLFHQGFETLEDLGGAAHPFVIAKLGSVVGAVDMPGIYFYGRQREKLYETQRRIHERARYVTVLSEPAGALFASTHGSTEFLLVPGAAEATVPPPGSDPYPRRDGIRCVFSGNFYHAQPAANRVLTDKLNRLGASLQGHGRVFVVGPGDTSGLDTRYVTYLGVVPYERSWDHLYFADVGVVVSAGPFMHNNESTKIYHYLRAGLPVVSESGFPNDDVVRQAGLGFVVDSGDLAGMAQRVEDASRATWDRATAVRYMMEHHTWDRRVDVYERLFRQHSL